MNKLDLVAANQELQTNTYEQIQDITAWKWASRSAMSYLRSTNSQKIEEKLRWFQYGVEFEGEALEHAGLASTKLLTEIKELLYSYCVKCKDELKKYKVGDSV